MNSQFMRRKNKRKFRYQYSDEALVGLLEGSDSENATSEAVNLAVKTKPQIDFIEHEIKEGETISSLSLQFNCTISQIKQLNNIHRDNEIYALQVVRIPIIPFSVVTERLGGAAPDSSNVDGLIDIGFDTKHELVNLPEGDLVDSCMDQQQSDVDSSSDISVCNPLLTPLPAPVMSSSPIYPTIDVEAPEIQTPHHNSSNFLSCNGADCGIPWLMLLVCTLVVGFVGPLIYIFLLYEEKKHISEGALSS